MMSLCLITSYLILERKYAQLAWLEYSIIIKSLLVLIPRLKCSYAGISKVL